MKLLGLIAGLTLIVGLGFALYLFPRTANVPTTEVISATATTLKPDLFLVPVAGGEAKVEKTASVLGGETLHTSATGRALIETEGASSVLDYNSSFTLTGDATHTTGKLAIGQVWSRVEKLFGQGEFFEIETGNAVAVVRGTSFNVSFVGGVSSVIVKEGTVAVIPKDNKTGERLFERTVLVSAGEKATVKNGLVTVTAILAGDKKTDWFMLNNPADSEGTIQVVPTSTPTNSKDTQPIATSTPSSVITPKETTSTSTATNEPTPVSTGSSATAEPKPTGPNPY